MARGAARTAAVLLGLSVPALLITALWMWDWRWAATSLVAGATALAMAGSPDARPRRRKAPWPEREDLPEEQGGMPDTDC